MEIRKKLSVAHKGNVPWNKNKSGVMPPAWNKGIKLSKKHKKHKNLTNVKLTDYNILFANDSVLE